MVLPGAAQLRAYMMFFKRTAVLAAAILGMAAGAVAEGKIPSLDRGMGYLDVIKAWGPPTEKQQFETKRRDIWYFPYGKVSFFEGRVKDWALSAPSRGKVTTAALNTNRSGSRGMTGSDSLDSDPALVEEILEEIMREAPSADDKPGAPGVPPPPIGVAPGGIPNPLVQ